MSTDVLMLLPDNDHESDSRVQREATTLARAGYRLTVIARASGRTGPPKLSPAGYRIEYVGLRGHEDYTHTFARRAANIDARVVHAHDVGGLIFAHESGKFGNSRVVYDAHEYHRSWDGPVSWARPAEDGLLPSADVVITVSGGIAELLQKDHRLEERPIVIRNCMSAGSGCSGAGLRARIGLGAETPLAVFCGWITLEDRGLEVVFDALAEVPEWHLAIVGDGPGVEPLRKLAACLGLTNRVHFVGRLLQAELLPALHDADVGLSLNQNLNLSYFHSLPNKLFEYILAGCGGDIQRLPGYPRAGRAARRWCCRPVGFSRIGRARAPRVEVVPTRRSRAGARRERALLGARTGEAPRHLSRPASPAFRCVETCE